MLGWLVKDNTQRIGNAAVLVDSMYDPYIFLQGLSETKETEVESTEEEWMKVKSHGRSEKYFTSLGERAFFLISNSEGWSPTGSTRHCGHQLAYCICPGWLWGWRIWLNDDWQGKLKYSEKTCPVPLRPPQIPHDLNGRETGTPLWEASD
jgi:hypothetical protein